LKFNSSSFDTFNGYNTIRFIRPFPLPTLRYSLTD
jgi:hypothetical protein